VTDLFGGALPQEDELPAVTRAEGLVLWALHLHGCLAWDELARHTGLKPQTVSPRLKPLRLRGLIEDSGEKFGGYSGARQVKWKLTELGKRVVAKRVSSTPHAPTAHRPDAVTSAMIDALTLEDFELILGPGGMKLHGWLKKRMKRAIRYITEGRIWDDPGDDGAKTPRQIQAPIPHRHRDRVAALKYSRRHA